MATDADAQAYIDAVETAKSGTFNSIYEDAIDQLVIDLKADGIWAKLDRIWIYRNESQEAAQICIKSLETLSEISSPTFAIGVGYTGNGVDMALNTNFNPSNDATNYTLDSASFGIKFADGTSFTGEHGGGNTYILESSGSYFWRINAGGDEVYGGDENAFGLFHFNRAASGSMVLYKNGSQVDSETETSTQIDDESVHVLARRSGLSTGGFSPDTAELTFFGGDLSAEATDLDQAVDDYITNIQFNPTGMNSLVGMKKRM